MAIRDIVKLPASLLRTISAPVPEVTDEVRRFLDDMLATMYAAPGIGLAAIQVGDPRRIVVIDTARNEEPKSPLFFINPEIVWSSEETSEYEEGCLSIPEIFEKVSRPAEVKVSFLNREGERQEMHCNGLLATCIQHEIDHLNGVLFLDRISRLKRERAIKKYTKLQREKELADA